MEMATKLIQPSIAAAAAVRGVSPGGIQIKRSAELKQLKVASFSYLNCKMRSFDDNPFRFKPIFIRKVAEQSSGLVPEQEQEQEREEEKTISQIKEELYRAIKGINRGIFGVPSAKKSEIECLIKQLECWNPTAEPTGNLDKVEGCWKLVYTTITILGSKRTKLGLRDFISLGDFLQQIDVSQGKSVNLIKFNVRGLNLLDGQLRIDASFKIASKSRVDIKYESSRVEPDQLMSMFRKNYDLLLGIFNPDGWVEISYLDEDLRVGRDDKGNIFVLEKAEEH